MSKAQEKRRNQIKLARLEIVAEMYKRGNSLRKIQSEVMKRLELPSYSLATVHKDVNTLLQEWRENRVKDMDDIVTLELERLMTLSVNCGGSGEIKDGLQQDAAQAERFSDP